MKLTTSPTFLAILACLPVSQLSAFTTSFPLSMYPVQGMEVAGVDGWTINDPGSNNGSGSGLNETMSFVYSLDGVTPSAALGGWNDIPAAGAPTTVFLSHAAPTSLQHSSFDVDFAISRNALWAFNGRDGFGFSVRDAADNNLLTISLVPVSSTNNDAYQVRYTIGSESQVNAKNADTGFDMYIYQNGFYSLSFDFTPDGVNPTFIATLVGGNGPQSFTDVATGLGSAVIQRVGAEWNTIPGQEGANFITFDNISLVPEPSSTLLICLAGLGFISRRKRP